ncbi:MAG: tetratricopeptide (TPR) repeat protein [Halieaceae bacterium]|jgi:tetratricopeptide (TPR) repeat protein
MTPLQQAATFLQQGKLKEAETIYQDLLRENPSHGMALWGLGRIAVIVQQYDAAIKTLASAVQALPGNHLVVLELATVLERTGRHEEAGRAYLVAQQYAPEDKQVRYLHALYQVSLGDVETAIATLRELLELDPQMIPAWFVLSGLKTFTPDDPDVAALGVLLLQQDLSDEQKLQLRYALGKALHDCGEYSSAFAHFEEANRLDQQRADFEVDEMEGFFGQVREIFNAELLAQPEDTESGDTDPWEATPIFIVGQPRSGSTLLEQMLTSHAEIATAGEVSFLGDTIAHGLKHFTGAGFPQGCAALSAEQRADLGRTYLKQLQRAAPNSRYVIDKLPANYQSIGMIRLMLPQALIVHLRRDPMDVCFSIYRHYFQANEPFFSTQQAIGLYHGFYESMMAHWSQVLPDFVHTQHYEDLVEDPETVLRQVLVFCGLEWQASCLNYTEGQRHINTLSQTQVRAPLNRNTGGAWRHYGENLRPLLDVVN